MPATPGEQKDDRSVVGDVGDGIPDDFLVELEVPIPISANNMYANRRRGGKRYSDKYEAWLEECKDYVEGAYIPDGIIEIWVHIYGGKGVRADRDCDNFEKPSIDMLRHKGVLDRDDFSRVRLAAAMYHPPESKKAIGRCVIRIRRMRDVSKYD